MFYLVAVAGEKRGNAWPVSEAGLLVGRAADNDVVLEDPVVSRRHCRLFLNSGTVHLQDEGGRNPVLVNGVPSQNKKLEPGDELSLGRQRFLVSDAMPIPRLHRPAGDGTDTVSWEKAEPITLPLDAAHPADENRPQTLQDLVMLHEVTRELSRCTTIASLVETVERRVMERFAPQGLWVAFAQGEEDFVFYQQGPAGEDAPPMKAIRRAIGKREGFLAPSKGRLEGTRGLVFTMTAPIVMGDENLGALALITGPPHGAYSEDDLRVLVLLAQSLAPLLWVVTDMEQLRRDYEQLRERSGQSLELVGKSRAIARVRGQIATAARSKLNVLITGETGTGKELVARSLHAQSGLRGGPLIVANCAAIPHDLFESTLFGHVKGAFTGAHESRIGLMAQAHGGVIFLDEIAELSIPSQATILRAIEYGTFLPVGAKEEVRVDIRVVAATNKDIRAAVKKGDFREDLYHRLNGFEIHIPPLRQRPSDIPILAMHFFNMAKAQAKRPIIGITPEALDYLRSQAWQGNVRELRNRIFRAVEVARHETLGLRDVRAQDGSGEASPSAPTALKLADVEKAHITAVLSEHAGNIKKSSEVLGIARSTLYSKMDEYGIK